MITTQAQTLGTHYGMQKSKWQNIEFEFIARNRKLTRIMQCMC